MSRINTNVAANTAYTNLTANGRMLNKSIEKLSSGFRVNRAGDDAAGMAIANKLRSDVRSLRQAGRNAEQGSSMLQIADGAVNTIASILDRMKELASQANSSSVGNQTDKLQAEFDALVLEIDRIADTTKYNGAGLVNGSLGTTVDTNPANTTVLAVANVSKVTSNGAAAGTYAIDVNGAGNLRMTNGGKTQTISNAGGAQTLNFSLFGISIETGAAYVADAAIGNVVLSGTTASFMVGSSGDYAGQDRVSLSQVNLKVGATSLDVGGQTLGTLAGASAALAKIDTAIGKVADAIGTLGAAQNRFDYAATNVASLVQNTAAAESTIRDADMAFEMTVFTKNQILQQAGTAMLAQANQAPQSILSLLR